MADAKVITNITENRGGFAKTDQQVDQAVTNLL